MAISNVYNIAIHSYDIDFSCHSKVIHNSKLIQLLMISTNDKKLM